MPGKKIECPYGLRLAQDRPLTQYNCRYYPWNCKGMKSFGCKPFNPIMLKIDREIAGEVLPEALITRRGDVIFRELPKTPVGNEHLWLVIRIKKDGSIYHCHIPPEQIFDEVKYQLFFKGADD